MFGHNVALALGFVPLGDDGVNWGAIDLQLNVYTAPGFLGAILAVFNIVLLLLFFHEHKLKIWDLAVPSSPIKIQASGKIVF